MNDRILLFHFHNGRTIPVVYDDNQQREDVISKFEDYVRNGEVSPEAWLICPAGVFRYKDIQYMVRVEYLPYKMLQFLNIE